MKDKYIKEARSSISRYQLEIEKCKEIRMEMKALESDPNVKRYLKLTDNQTYKIKSRSELIIEAFDGEKDDCDIYVYMGAFIRSHDASENDYRVLDDCENVSYYLYKRLGNWNDYATIEKNYKQEFDENNTIIKFNDSYASERNFHIIQLYYYELLMQANKLTDDSIKRKVLRKAIKL
jgi:hypothetical protein